MPAAKGSASTPLGLILLEPYYGPNRSCINNKKADSLFLAPLLFSPLLYILFSCSPLKTAGCRQPKTPVRNIHVSNLEQRIQINRLYSHPPLTDFHTWSDQSQYKKEKSLGHHHHTASCAPGKTEHLKTGTHMVNVIIICAVWAIQMCGWQSRCRKAYFVSVDPQKIESNDQRHSSQFLLQSTGPSSPVRTLHVWDLIPRPKQGLDSIPRQFHERLMNLVSSRIVDATYIHNQTKETSETCVA